MWDYYGDILRALKRKKWHYNFLDGLETLRRARGGRTPNPEARWGEVDAETLIRTILPPGTGVATVTFDPAWRQVTIVLVCPDCDANTIENAVAFIRAETG